MRSQLANELVGRLRTLVGNLLQERILVEGRVGPGPGSETRRVKFGDRREDVAAAHGLRNNNAMTRGARTRVYGVRAWRLAPEDFAMASTYEGREAARSRTDRSTTTIWSRSTTYWPARNH